MAEKNKITASRERLDMALASPGLSSEEPVKLLVTSQLLRSPFPGTEEELKNIVKNRSDEVFNFMDMLRSASSVSNASHADWKMKQDTEQVRVMYREGPQGSPFHTLLVEGFADGPIDVCLCVSWESTLYKKWWPHFSVPPFKIITSTCLNRVRIGEEISLMRMKVPWPLTDREVLLHYFEIEYPEEDLIFVLIKTIPDGEPIDLRTHGFTGDGIPEPEDSVRMDVIGGFVLQKISPSRCYFRSIANMDIKLDFVPPSLINFISRQLIGNGYKLYQKVVSSVANTDNDYREVLKRELYSRLRCKEEEEEEETSSPELSPALDKKLISGEIPVVAEVICGGDIIFPELVPEPDKKLISSKITLISQVIYGDKNSALPNLHKKLNSGEIAEVTEVIHEGDPALPEPSSAPDKKLISSEILVDADVIHAKGNPVSPVRDKKLNSSKILVVADKIHAKGDLAAPESLPDSSSAPDKKPVGGEIPVVAGEPTSPAQDKKLNSRGVRISPEVENALSMMNQAIAVFREIKSQQISQSLPAIEAKDSTSEERETHLPTISVDKHDLQLKELRHEGDEEIGRKTKKGRRFFLLSCFNGQ